MACLRRSKVIGSGAAACLLALSIAGCGGARSPSGNDVEVTGVGPNVTVVSGNSAVFTMTVTNIGNNPATDVKLVDTPGNYLAVSEIRCAASGGAVCPEPTSIVMTLPSLPVGGTLVFEVVATVNPLVDGTVANTMVATLNDDVNRVNNSASATAAVAVSPPDPSGAYKVYAADGQQYELTIDFTRGTYTMSGSGLSETRSFSASPDGTYVVSGDQRFRVAQDLIVGSHDFATSITPYVAARSFVTGIGALAGAFNLMTRNVNPDGTLPVTRAGTARVSGNVLQVCEDDIVVVQVQACDLAALKSYLLSVSDDYTFTGSEAATGETIAFRVARSGAAAILLSAGSSSHGDVTMEWRIGLTESAALAGGTVQGPGVYPSGIGDWLRIDLSGSTYAAVGAGMNDVADLTRSGPQSPTSMLQGNAAPTLGGAPIWVMQAYPLVVVIGATNSAVGVPSASGMLQIGVP